SRFGLDSCRSCMGCLPPRQAPAREGFTVHHRHLLTRTSPLALSSEGPAGPGGGHGLTVDEARHIPRPRPANARGATSKAACISLPPWLLSSSSLLLLFLLSEPAHKAHQQPPPLVRHAREE